MPVSRTRRQFLSAAAQAAAVAALPRSPAVAREEGAAYREIFEPLDRFARQYLRALNAPGMTLVLADREGVRRVATYGSNDPAGRVPIGPEQLFQIGSISKSFVGLCVLQLRDQGKLDLDRPVVEYLPWLRIDSAYPPITTHHLLTHTSGLPSMPHVFPSDPRARHRAAYAPGAYFHYCNMGYAALGQLVWTLDGRPLPEALRARILEPLGMTRSEPVITLDARDRIATSWANRRNDRPYRPLDPLAEAPAVVYTEGAGSVAATARDMGLYVQLLANRGRGPKGRIVSEESFALFEKPHVKAETFGPTISYGYGIAVDTLDGHRVLRHTGGMLSFASALEVDVEEGVGAFASVNAMQGYRPHPVVEYAIRLMRAHRARRPLPVPPIPDPPTRVKDASAYAGTYRSPEGRSLEVAAGGERLWLVHRGERVPLAATPVGTDRFVAAHPDFERFVLVFGRADAKQPASPVVELGWGGEWFAHPRYSGPTRFEHPEAWHAYVGHYRNESPWLGSMHIVLRKGRLMIDGLVPLEPGDGGTFHLRDEEHSPEWISFGEIVNGRAMRLKYSGEDLWRVAAA